MMTRHLRNCEADIHRSGWNQPPVLAEIIQLPSGKLIPQVLPMRITDPPVHYLAFTAEVMTEHPAIARGIAVDGPDMVALAFCHESWSKNGLVLPAEPGYEITEKTVGTALADEPGAVQVRSFAVVDIWGRVHHVHRERGQKPLAGSAEVKIHGGSVNICLAQILCKVVPYLEDGDEGALIKLRDEMLAYSEALAARSEDA